MIINKIIPADEERQRLYDLNKQYSEAIIEYTETIPDEMRALTDDQVLSDQAILGAVAQLSSIARLKNIQLTKIEDRHMDELGTADAVLEEATEIIQALEKKDFQNYIRGFREGLQKDMQTERMKKDKAFQDMIKQRAYSFESAYRYILRQVKPYYRRLQELDEKKELQLEDGTVKVKYIELLQIEALRKARDDFGYKPKAERKKRGEKQTISLSEELTAVEDIEKSNLYSKIISDNFTGSIEMSVGKKVKVDTLSQYRITETKDGQLTFLPQDVDTTFLEELDKKAITAETLLVMYMLLEQLLPQLPTLKTFPKGKMTPAQKAEKEKIEETLNKESVRTVELTLSDYMERRKLKGDKAYHKKVIEYALISLGSLEKTFDSNGTRYNMFSARPQEMYKAGNIKAVFNRDWLIHLYEDGSTIARIPYPLFTVNLRKHQYAVNLYVWLRQNYDRNAKHQAPNTNRVKIRTTIENIPSLNENYMEEQENGHGRYWQRVFDPLLRNLDALKDTYGLLDYEILDKDKRKIPKSKLNSMPTKTLLECWIRYEFKNYPNWAAPEQLTTRKKREK